MESHDNFVEERDAAGEKISKNKISIEKDSLQYNSQDLDQEQRVDVNPVQQNTQNLRIYVCNEKEEYSAKITGTTYLKRNKEIVSNVGIMLFFGCESNRPIYKTSSDSNGNFVIQDLPPGYYTIVATLGENLKFRSHYIKIFPGQSVHQSVLLAKIYSI